MTLQSIDKPRSDESKSEDRELLRRHYLAVREHPECTLAYLDYLSRLYWRITWEGSEQ